MEILVFNGGYDAYFWVLCTEKYFKVRGTQENEKMTLAETAMSGCARKWWCWWSPRHPGVNWDAFTTAFLWRFKPDYHDILPIFDEEEEPDPESPPLMELNGSSQESLNATLQAWDEFLLSTEQIEVPTVHAKKLTVATVPPTSDFNGGIVNLLEATTTTTIATTESFDSSDIVVDQGEFSHSTVPIAMHSIFDENSVPFNELPGDVIDGNAARNRDCPHRSEASYKNHRRSKPMGPPSLLNKEAIYPLLVVAPPPPKPPELTYYAVKNPPPPPAPPDRSCCVMTWESRLQNWVSSTLKADIRSEHEDGEGYDGFQIDPFPTQMGRTQPNGFKNWASKRCGMSILINPPLCLRVGSFAFKFLHLLNVAAAVLATEAYACCFAHGEVADALGKLDGEAQDQYTVKLNWVQGKMSSCYNKNGRSFLHLPIILCLNHTVISFVEAGRRTDDARQAGVNLPSAGSQVMTLIIELSLDKYTVTVLLFHVSTLTFGFCATLDISLVVLVAIQLSKYIMLYDISGSYVRHSHKFVFAHNGNAYVEGEAVFWAINTTGQKLRAREWPDSRISVLLGENGLLLVCFYKNWCDCPALFRSHCNCKFPNISTCFRSSTKFLYVGEGLDYFVLWDSIFFVLVANNYAAAPSIMSQLHHSKLQIDFFSISLQTYVTSGYELDGVFGSNFFVLYAKQGSIDNAFSLFERLPDRDVVAWSALITCCARIGSTKLVASLFMDIILLGLKIGHCTLLVFCLLNIHFGNNPIFHVVKLSGNAMFANAIGGCVLCVLSLEAMFANLGQLSIRAILIAFTCIVFWCLLLAYMGHAADLLKNSTSYSNTFLYYVLGPRENGSSPFGNDGQCYLALQDYHEEFLATKSSLKDCISHEVGILDLHQAQLDDSSYYSRDKIIERVGAILIFLARHSMKWDPGGNDCFVFLKQGSLQFNQWDPGGCPLIHGNGSFDLVVTWKDATIIQQYYLGFNLEDKVDFNGGGNVMILIEEEDMSATIGITERDSAQVVCVGE